MNDNILASKRELWIDVLRGVAILIVVLGHTNSPYKSIIYSFHIPLFFLLSGFLWNCRRKQTNYHTILRRNATRYLVPYFILCGINLGIEYGISVISHDDFNLKKYIIGILYSRGTRKWMPNCSPLWYLTACFLSLCLFDAIQRVKNKKIRWGIIIICAVISSFLDHYNVFKLPWNIDTAMMGIFLIGLGSYIFNEGKLFQRLKSNKVLTQIIVIVTLLFTACSSAELNPVKSISFDGNRYGNVILMLTGALSICFVIFYLCYIIPWKGKVSRYLSWLGQHTIFIMGFDYFTGKIARAVLEKAGLINWASVFLLKVILLTIGCLIWTWAVNKIRNESIRRVLLF